MTALVGIHGVGQYRSGETADGARASLGATWRKHLSRGPLGQLPASFDVEVAYYAHLLRPPGRQGGEGGLDDLEPDAELLLRAWLEEFDLPTSTSQGPATIPLRQAVAWIAGTRGLGRIATERFVATFFREVAAYVRTPDGPARVAARSAVAETIRRCHPRVVLAHSLGSVVTYETLWAHPELAVDLLVTLGSPLALPYAVFPRLVPAPVSDRGCRPPGVGKWVNLADVGDLVAIPPRGISRSFTDVDADEHAAIHAFDFHLAANYLASRRLADHLRCFLAP